MAFFPLIKTKHLDGFCVLHNFSTNNWEPFVPSKKNVWAIYSDGEKWVTKFVDEIDIGFSRKYFYSDVYQGELKGAPSLILLQFRKSDISGNLKELPSHEFIFNKVPEWRSTVGFTLNKSETSYQGEIEPFPQKASLLTFHPFIQYRNINNYFLFLNIEKYPSYREEEIEIFEANSKKLIDKVKVKNNSANLIDLNKYNFSPNQLPVFICRLMAGIPFGLGIQKNQKMLSMEHTHPPASFVIHGDRFKVQREIKRRWFNILKNIDEK